MRSLNLKDNWKCLSMNLIGCCKIAPWTLPPSEDKLVTAPLPMCLHQVKFDFLSQKDCFSSELNFHGLNACSCSDKIRTPSIASAFFLYFSACSLQRCYTDPYVGCLGFPVAPALPINNTAI